MHAFGCREPANLMVWCRSALARCGHGVHPRWRLNPGGGGWTATVPPS